MSKMRCQDFEVGDAVMWDPSVDHETRELSVKYGVDRIMTVAETTSYFIHVNHTDVATGGWLPYRFKKVPKFLLHVKEAIKSEDEKEKHAQSSRSKSKSK